MYYNNKNNNCFYNNYFYYLIYLCFYSFTKNRFRVFTQTTMYWCLLINVYCQQKQKLYSLLFQPKTKLKTEATFYNHKSLDKKKKKLIKTYCHPLSLVPAHFHYSAVCSRHWGPMNRCPRRRVCCFGDRSQRCYCDHTSAFPVTEGLRSWRSSKVVCRFVGAQCHSIGTLSFLIQPA